MTTNDNNIDLIQVAKKGDLEAVKRFIVDAGGKIDNEIGVSAIKSALSEGHVYVARALMQAGVNIFEDEKGGSARISYSMMAALKSAQKLHAERLDAFYNAAARGDIESLKKGIEQGMSLTEHKPNYCEGDVLCAASKNGHVKAVEFLIAAGADVRGHSGEEALECALKEDQTEVALILLRAGADILAIGLWRVERAHSEKDNPPVRRLYQGCTLERRPGYQGSLLG